MRSPFTGVVFAVELTHDVNVILPLLLAAVIAHAFTVLTLRRSILTEKISRRGHHLSREYSVDPLEILFAREVMRTNLEALRPEMSLAEIAEFLQRNRQDRRRQLYPVVDAGGNLTGVVTRHELEELAQHGGELPFTDLVRRNPAIAHPDEPLRVVVSRMAQTGRTRFPVVERGEHRKFVGMISLDDLLKARIINLEAERRRERILPFHLLFPFRSRGNKVNKIA